MKDNEDHLTQEKLIEYLYKESQNPEEIETHLLACKSCKGIYSALQRDMEAISDDFRRGFWAEQKGSIMSVVRSIQAEKHALRTRRLMPAIVLPVLVFLILGIYIKLNRHKPIEYSQEDVTEEILLEHVAELVDQPLTSALDFLDFQEEDIQEQLYTYSLERLEVFGFWPELDT